MIISLSLECPAASCRTPLRTIPSATTPGAAVVAHRTCPGCRARWRVFIVPLQSSGPQYVHRIGWTCERGALRERCLECDACQEYILDPPSAPSCTRMKATKREDAE